MLPISPVPMEQLVRGRDGRQWTVHAHESEVAKRLVELDPTLSVGFHEDGGYYTIIQTPTDGPKKGQELAVENVSADEWDDRVILRWQMRAWELRHGISSADRLDAHDARVKADQMHELEEAIGEKAYPLMRSIQRNLLGVNPRAFIRAPKPIPTPAAA